LPDELRELHRWLWELDYDQSVEWTGGRPPGENVWRTAQANRLRGSPSEQLFYAEDGLLRRHGEEDPARGTVTDRYPNGQVEREFTLEGGKIVGEFREFHVNGQLKASRQFEDGKEHGPYVEYDQRGNRVKVGQFVGGLAQGAWSEFDARGTTRREYEMSDGQLHGVERIYNGRSQLIKENWFDEGELVRSQAHKPQ
jgi:antitoxin component YwqK of YwqJK toxin-antitoxin module